MWILIPVLLVFLTAAVVAIVFGVKLFAGPVDATNEYYADLRAGSYSAAYGRLCSSLQVRYTEDEFVALQEREERTLGRVTSYNFTTSEFQDGFASTEGTVRRGLLGSHQIEVRLDREDDEWKVCGTRRL